MAYLCSFKKKKWIFSTNSSFLNLESRAEIPHQKFVVQNGSFLESEGKRVMLKILALPKHILQKLYLIFQKSKLKYYRRLCQKKKMEYLL